MGLKSIVWFLLEPAWGTSGKYSREVKGENVPQNRFFSVFSSRAVLLYFSTQCEKHGHKTKNSRTVRLKLVYFHSNICGCFLQKLILMTWLIVPCRRFPCMLPIYPNYLEIYNVPIQAKGKWIKSWQSYLGLWIRFGGRQLIELYEISEFTLDMAVWPGEEAGNVPPIWPESSSLLVVSLSSTKLYHCWTEPLGFKISWFANLPWE